MGVRENLQTLYNDADELVKRSIDRYRLLFVESVSLLYGDVACGFVLFMLLFLALVLILVAMVVMLAPLMGIVWALMLAIALLMIMALLVYVFRIRIFVNRAVKRLCRILFANKNEK